MPPITCGVNLGRGEPVGEAVHIGLIEPVEAENDDGAPRPV